MTLNEKQGQHLKYMPYAFTEQGVAMLSSVLRSQTAIEVNIQIMRAFVSMRHFMVNNASVFSRLETMEYHQFRYYWGKYYYSSYRILLAGSFYPFVGQ